MSHTDQEKKYSEYEMRSAVALAYEDAAQEVAKGRFNMVGLRSYFESLAVRTRTGKKPLMIFALWQKQCPDKTELEDKK